MNRPKKKSCYKSERGMVHVFEWRSPQCNCGKKTIELQQPDINIDYAWTNNAFFISKK